MSQPLESLGSLASQADLDALKNNVQRFVYLRTLYEAGVREVRARLETLDSALELQESGNPIHHIQSRIKSPESILRKLRARGHEVSFESIEKNITDIAGVRVICRYPRDIYRIADMLRAQDDVRVTREKDYIKTPKENGYRSLHLVVEVPVFLCQDKCYVPVEIQIRTVAMDFWASLEHEMHYKAAEDVPAFIVDELKRCADVIAQTDEKMELIYRALQLLRPDSRASQIMSTAISEGETPGMRDA